MCMCTVEFVKLLKETIFVYRSDINLFQVYLQFFRAKTERLRKQQENMVYKKIVQSVDASQKYGKINLVENFGAELKVR